MRRPLSRRPRAFASILVGAFALALGACAPHVAEAFRSAKNAGDRAYSAGRYDEAANAYRKASEEAGRPRDRAEALYLEAFSYHRAKAWDRARTAYQRLVVEMPTTDLARRASFNLADIEIDTGNAETGYAEYHRLLRKHPNEALARRALERSLTYLDRTGGDAVAWLRALLPNLAGTELDETARYRLAGYVESAGDVQSARDLYLECAGRHPYPEGALFDDSLWHAARLEEKLGRPAEAIAHLRRMLAARETSTMMGSYERPRFSPAQFRVAELYRDALGDRAAARREFHRLYESHPTSILRDDALWEEAKLSRDSGDLEQACALAATLVREFASSRYAPCAREVCPSLSAPSGRCHGYLMREKDAKSDEPTPAGQD